MTEPEVSADSPTTYRRFDFLPAVFRAAFDFCSFGFGFEFERLVSA